MAAITHRHDEFHRGLVPEDQLADDTPTAGFVVTATGAGEAEWAPGSGASGGLVLTYDDANFTAADPGNGVFRANNADPTIASVLYIDDLDANGVNIQPWIDTWNNEAFGYLRLRSVSDPETFITYRVTDYTNDTGFSQVDVEYVGGVSPLTGTGDTGIEFWPNAYPGPPEIDSLLTPETDDTLRLAPDGVGGVEWAAGGGGGAPDDATYLVGAAHAGLSAEIVVGATPGGELGNTWASPTVDATHSGSTHAATQAAAEATAAGADAAHVAAADPHTGYLKESDFDDIDFLVGTATGFTAAEIVVGTSPAGELGGTWASPTIDATHSGSSHAGLAGVYNVALQGFVSMYASLGAGTYSLLGYEAGANAVASGVAGPIAVFRLTAAELSVSGLTPKLNIQAYVACSGTTPGAGWTATYGLYPITSSGTTNLAFTAGTVVAGSTAAPAWAINTIAVATSGDFTLPADGAYGLYVVTNQALAANMVVRTGAKVRFRNV